MSDGSSRAAPPPVGSTLEGWLAGAGVAWASALELGHRRPIARAAARVGRAFFKAIDLGFAVMAVSFRVENRFPLYLKMP